MGSISIGNQQLDQLLGGGIEQEKSTILVGKPGCGKTALALQFITDSNINDSGAYICIDKTPERLMKKATTLYPSSTNSIANNMLKFVEISLHDWGPHKPLNELIIQIDRQIDALFQNLQVSRLVIDSLLPHALHSLPIHQKLTFIHSFLSIIQRYQTTSLCILYDVECHESLWLNTDFISDQLIFNRNFNCDYTTYWLDISTNNDTNKHGRYRFTLDPMKGLKLKHKQC